MNDIWQHIIADVLPKCSADLSTKLIFFDLADPRKRSTKDIRRALHLIESFSKCGLRTMMGLNQKEAQQIAQTLGISVDFNSMQELSVGICNALNINCVAIHRADCAGCAQDGNYTEVKSLYCSNPRVLTGAGDVFNSGFVFAQTQGWPQDISLSMGVMASGYYVRHAHSANRNELISFIESLD